MFLPLLLDHVCIMCPSAIGHFFFSISNALSSNSFYVIPLTVCLCSSMSLKFQIHGHYVVSCVLLDLMYVVLFWLVQILYRACGQLGMLYHGSYMRLNTLLSQQVFISLSCVSLSISISSLGQSPLPSFLLHLDSFVYFSRFLRLQFSLKIVFILLCSLVLHIC